MITLRCRPSGGVDWTTASFDGEHSELAAHSFILRLQECGWEILRSGGEEGEWDELEDWWNS